MSGATAPTRSRAATARETVFSPARRCKVNSRLRVKQFLPPTHQTGTITALTTSDSSTVKGGPHANRPLRCSQSRSIAGQRDAQSEAGAGDRSAISWAELLRCAGSDASQVRNAFGVRRVAREHAPVQAAAATFGFSRVAWYQISARYAQCGLAGLLPQRRGPQPHPQKQR